MTLLHETPHTSFTASSFAPQPAEGRGLARDEVRLLVATPDGLSHGRFRDLPDHLRAGDVLPLEIEDTITAKVDGVPVMECGYGIFNGQYALRVQKMIGAGDSMKEGGYE